MGQAVIQIPTRAEIPLSMPTLGSPVNFRTGERYNDHRVVDVTDAGYVTKGNMPTRTGRRYATRSAGTSNHDPRIGDAGVGNRSGCCYRMDRRHRDAGFRGRWVQVSAGRPTSMETTDEAYNQLLDRAKQVKYLRDANYLLNWDQQVVMPPGGAPARSKQRAAVSTTIHELVTTDEVGEWLDAVDEKSLDGDERAVVREVRRRHERESAVPSDVVSRLGVKPRGFPTKRTRCTR